MAHRSIKAGQPISATLKWTSRHGCGLQFQSKKKFYQVLVPPKLLPFYDREQVDLSSIIFWKRRSMPIPNVHHQDLCNLFNSGYSCDHPSGLVWSLDWLITWLHASSFLRKSFLAPNSKISESLPISKFGSVSIENESALLSTLVKTLSAEKTLTLQK